MANQEHVDFLKQCADKGTKGIEEWNKWREEHPEIIPDLSGTMVFGNFVLRKDLSKIDFHRTILTNSDFSSCCFQQADLSKAILREAKMIGARLCEANLTKADLSKSNFYEADLSNTKLNKANLSLADFRSTNLSEADLEGANLIGAILINANLQKANLSNCKIYGVAAWDVQLKEARQFNLVITFNSSSAITVDNLEVAQFIYLLLHNQKIRSVIDTITSKVVLILGRFTPERKQVLDALREELRNHNYSPIVFDFDKPSSRDLTETVSILARLSRFIIADITDPSCIPQELYAVMPDCIVPVQPLLSSQSVLIDGLEIERRPYSMFKDLQRRYQWVLPTYRYQDTNQLLSSIKDNIIMPAEEKGKELERRKNGSI